MTFNTPSGQFPSNDYPSFRGGCSDPGCRTCYPDRSSGGVQSNNFYGGSYQTSTSTNRGYEHGGAGGGGYGGYEPPYEPEVMVRYDPLTMSYYGPSDEELARVSRGVAEAWDHKLKAEIKEVRPDSYRKVIQKGLDTDSDKYGVWKEPKESWCKCGTKHLPNNLPKEFLGGLTDFKEQWLEHSNILERSEIDKIKKNHDKICFDRYISDTYAGYNDSPLGDD